MLSFGEALWDLMPDGRRFSGAPFNFAFRMHTLGHESCMVSRLGCDSYGERALQQIETLGMKRITSNGTSVSHRNVQFIWTEERRLHDYSERGI